MEPASRIFTPFWPLLALIALFCIQTEYRLYNLYQARVVAEENIRQITPQAEAALTAKKKLFGLAQELTRLAPKSAAAAQIVTEFKIHAVGKEAEPVVEKIEAWKSFAG